MKKSNQLEKLASFRKELAIAETIEEIKQLENKTEAVSNLAKKEGVVKEQIDEIGEYWVEVVAKKGAWLDKFFPRGVRSDRRVAQTETLEMPVTPKESSRARTINRETKLVDKAINQLKKNKKKVVTPTAVENIVRREKKKIASEDPANLRKIQQEQTTRYFADTNSALNRALDRLTLIVQGEYIPSKIDGAHIIGIRNNLYTAIRLAMQVGIDVPKVCKTYQNRIEIAEHLTKDTFDEIEEAQIVP